MRVKTTEDAVLKACLLLLTLRGVVHLRLNSGAAKIGGRLVRFGTPGCPDLVFLPPGGDGRAVWCEVKRPGGRLSPAQRNVQDVLRRAGACCLVISDVADLDAALARLEADPRWRPES